MKLYAIFFLFALVACATQSTKSTAQKSIKALKVLPYQGACGTPCWIGKFSHDSSYHVLDFNLDGFKFEEGNFYIIRVQETTSVDPTTQKERKSYKYKNTLSKTAVTDQSSQLSSNKWHLDYMESSAVILEEKPWFQLRDNGSKINGFGGCNNFFGTVEVAKNTLKGSTFGSTQMFCNEGSLMEQKLLKALQQSCRYYITENQLVIWSEEVKFMVFKL